MSGITEYTGRYQLYNVHRDQWTRRSEAMMMMMKKPAKNSLSFFLIKWSIPLLISFQLSTNHYVRDAVGALEKQLEHDIPHFSPHVYSLMNALYFFPNIITPLLAGVFVDKLGGLIMCYIYSLAISAVGHGLFGLGIQFANIPLMLCGKAIAGTMYEILDALLPILYLGALYKEEFQLVVGFMQIFIRLGSVVNFAVTPVLYEMYGLKVALWVANGLGMSGLLLFLLAHYIECNWYKPIIDEFHTLEDTANGKEGKEESKSEHLSLPSQDYDSPEALHHEVRSPFSIETADDSEEDEEIVFAKDSFLQTQNNSGNDAKQAKAEEEPSFFGNLYSKLMDLTQFDKFDAQFYFYFFAGCFLYGSVVPFWFFGSKYFQENFNLPVQQADGLIALPELCMVIVGFPLGLIVTKYKWTIEFKMKIVCIAAFFVSAAHFSILFAALHRRAEHEGSSDSFYANFILCTVIVLGSGFAIACSLFWGAINGISDPKYFNEASGLVSCGVNIIPSVLPPILATIRISGDHQNIVAVAILGALCALCAFFATKPERALRLYSMLGRSDELETSDRSGGGSSRHGLLEPSQHNVQDIEMTPIHLENQ